MLCLRTLSLYSNCHTLLLEFEILITIGIYEIYIVLISQYSNTYLSINKYSKVLESTYREYYEWGST